MKIDVLLCLLGCILTVPFDPVKNIAKVGTYCNSFKTVETLIVAQPCPTKHIPSIQKHMEFFMKHCPSLSKLLTEKSIVD